MVRGVVATVTAAVLVALVVATAASSAGPPTSGITASCYLSGLTTVSGLKGNPTEILFTWYSQNDSQSFTQTVTTVGGRYGTTVSVATPTTDRFQTALVPSRVDYSIFYRRAVVPGSSPCVSPS